MHIVHKLISDSYSYCRICSLQVSRGSPAPAPWRAVRVRGSGSSDVTGNIQSWKLRLRPETESQSPDIAGRVTSDQDHLNCDVRLLDARWNAEMQTVLWENVRKGLNKQLWKVHCTVRRSERLPKVKLVITSLIDEYRQVCFDFQVFENPMKTEECQNRLKDYFFPSSNLRKKRLSSQMSRIESGVSQILGQLWRRYTQTYPNFDSSIKLTNRFVLIRE